MDPKALSVSPIKTSLIGHYFIHWQDFVILLFLKFPNPWFWNPKYGSNQETWIMDQNIYSHRMPSLTLEALALWKDKICRPCCLFVLFSLKKLSCMLSSGFNQSRHPQNKCLSLLWGGFVCCFLLLLFITAMVCLKKVILHIPTHLSFSQTEASELPSTMEEEWRTLLPGMKSKIMQLYR